MSDLRVLELPLHDNMTDEEIDQIYDNVKVKNKTYRCAFSVCWKDSPADIIEEVNQFLKNNGSKIEFLLGKHHNLYTFYVEKKKDK